MNYIKPFTDIFGLKPGEEFGILLSHLTRGAWIEIVKQGTPAEPTRSRTSHEVRGRNFGVLMDQFRDLHLKLHLTIAFLFTYNNKKGREW